MSYIKITNEISEVNRLYLEKLGLSTKRDDENTIGQFGSGSKFAPIAALRNGWRWINVGADQDGPYQMEYISKNESGIDSIYYQYTIDGEVVCKPSSFTLDAGVLSWDDHFQIFREAFSNALDEHISNNIPYSIDVVEEVVYEPGKFSVYLTASDELMKIVEDFDRWFDINRTPYYTTSYGSVYIPWTYDIAIYHKGVYVYGQVGDKNEVNLFDYTLNKVKLNEERRLRDTYYASEQIARIWMEAFLSTPDQENYDDAKKVCVRLLGSANNSHWEFAHCSPYHFDSYATYASNNALHMAWLEVYGDSVILSPHHQRFIFTLENVYGKKCVVIDNEMLYGQLILCGVTSVDDVAGDELEFDFVEFSSGSKADMLNTAMKIMSDYDSRINALESIRIFVPNSSQSSLLGVAKDNSIYISTNAFSDMEVLIGTLIHELDHAVSGLKDEDREFRSLADQRIAKLVLQLYGT
jgi:hypothetical protein